MPESPQFFSPASSLRLHIQPKSKSCKFFLFLKKQPLISTHRDTTLIHVLNISHHNYIISDLWSLSFTLHDAAKIISVLRLSSSLCITNVCFPGPVAILLNIPLPNIKTLYSTLTPTLRSCVLYDETHFEAFNLKPLLNLSFTIMPIPLWLWCAVMEIKGISPTSCASCQKTTCCKGAGTTSCCTAVDYSVEWDMSPEKPHTLNNS